MTKFSLSHHTSNHLIPVYLGLQASIPMYNPQYNRVAQEVEVVQRTGCLGFHTKYPEYTFH